MSSILFVFSKAPYGSINAQEGMDALLMGSAFTRCGVLFAGEGIMQLVSGQSTDALGSKNFPLGFGALQDYGVEQIACSARGLEERGLNTGDLLIDVKMMDNMQIRAFINDYDKVLNF